MAKNVYMFKSVGEQREFSAQPWSARDELSRTARRGMCVRGTQLRAQSLIFWG